MLMLPFVCFLVGAVLGQGFKVFVLVPAIALTLTVAIGFAHSETFWHIVSAAFLATSSLQIGYFAGVAASHLVAARVDRKNVVGPTESTSIRHTAN